MDRELFNALADATFIHALDGSIVEANRAALTTFGVSLERLLASNIEDLSAVEEGYTQERAAALVREARTAGALAVEWRCKRGDGTPFWCEVRLAHATLSGQERVVATVRDISRDKHTASRLELTRNQYTLLVRNLPGSLVLLFDHDLRFVLAEGPAIEATGLSKAALEAHTLFEALPAELAALVEANMRAALAGRAVTVELPLAGQWYACHYVPVPDETERIVYGMVLAMNVTERRRTEAALHASEQRLRAVADNAPAFILETSLDGTIEYVNRTRPGVPMEKVLGTNVLSWLAPDQADHLRSVLLRVAQGEVVPTEYRAVNSAGERRDFAATMAPIKVPGQATRVAMTTLDVTEYRRATAAERLAQERLADVAAQMPGFLFQYRVRPDGSAHFPFVSERVAHYYGTSAAELALDAAPVFAWIHPDDQADVARIIASSTITLEPLHSIHRIQAPGGELRFMEAAAVARRDADGSVLFSGYVFDVTKRELFARERELLIGELKASNAEMEQFTYTVSHDLKSPLVTIRGFLGMLERDIETGNRERALGDLVRIGSAADKMSRLLNDLLELSRVGRVAAIATAVDLAEVVREACELVAGPIALRRVTIELASELPVVLGDRIRLVQVLQNLIENAVKYMGDQPAPRIAVGAKLAPEKAVLFIRDNGIGLESRYHERIFGLFEKLDPKAEGTGVGLSLVKRVIEQQRGRVWVESEGLGQGCTFFVELPRSSSAV